MGKSAATWLLDIVRYLLITTGTATILWWSGTRFHVLSAVILAIPAYGLMLYLVDFLMLPLYLLAPEQRVISKALKAVEDGDFDTALRVLHAYERRHAPEPSDNPNSVTLAVGDREDEFAADRDDELLPDDGGILYDSGADQKESARPVRV